MNDLPTFAQSSTPQPSFAADAARAAVPPMPPRRPSSFPMPNAPMPPTRPPGLGADWEGMTAAPYTPEMQSAMDSPASAFAAPAQPAPVAAAPQAPMRTEEMNLGDSNILDQIGGFLENLFAQRQAPAGMTFDSLQGWIPDQTKGPR